MEKEEEEEEEMEEEEEKEKEETRKCTIHVDIHRLCAYIGHIIESL